MKRVIAALLSLSLCFALCSCKSQEATNVDNLICSIGEVTSESGNAIQKAETAVDALSEKDCEQLEHLDELKSARARYDDLVDRDKAEQLIDAINNVKVNVTLDSKDAIYAVSQHGATILDGEGSYEHCERQIVYSVVSAAQTKKVIHAVKEADPKAFINEVKTQKLSGRFYLPKES